MQQLARLASHPEGPSRGTCGPRGELWALRTVPSCGSPQGYTAGMAREVPSVQGLAERRSPRCTKVAGPGAPEAETLGALRGGAPPLSSPPALHTDCTCTPVRLYTCVHQHRCTFACTLAPAKQPEGRGAWTDRKEDRPRTSTPQPWTWPQFPFCKTRRRRCRAPGDFEVTGRGSECALPFRLLAGPPSRQRVPSGGAPVGAWQPLPRPPAPPQWRARTGWIGEGLSALPGAQPGARVPLRSLCKASWQLSRTLMSPRGCYCSSETP